jgi:hypothetical protein
MSCSIRGRFREQVRFLRRQFLQDGVNIQCFQCFADRYMCASRSRCHAPRPLHAVVSPHLRFSGALDLTRMTR